MTNQDRALAIMASLDEAEKAVAKALPYITDATKATALSASVAALHSELYTHASAMAAVLDLDMGELSLGGSK